MSIVLGFGSSEQERQKVETDFVDSFISEARGQDAYFTPWLIAQLEEVLKLRAAEADRLYEQYKTGDHPDRYSTFRATVLKDASNVVVIFHFSHINRCHPLSPDGWAAMYTTILHLVEFNP